MVSVPIPELRVDENGRLVATFDTREVVFSSASEYDRLLICWLQNCRRLPADDQAATPAAVGPIPWPRFETEVLALYLPPLRSKRTWEGMRYALRCLGKIGVQNTSDLTVATIADLVKSRPE